MQFCLARYATDSLPCLEKDYCIAYINSGYCTNIFFDIKYIMMTSKELREKYLEFFKKHGHKIIPSASLIPENDPTVLFTTAGMHPLVPFLLGEKHPSREEIS